MTRGELVKVLESDGYDVEWLTPSKILVKGVEHRLFSKGYIPASWFNDYRYCARRLALKILVYRRTGGMILGLGQLRSMVRGLLAHKLYMERLALGDTEVDVVSDTYRVGGRADEIREEQGVYTVIEVKTGWKPDLVAAQLQVMAYQAGVAEKLDADPGEIRGYVVYPGGVVPVSFNREMFEEYLRRIRVVLESSEHDLPPMLNGRLSHRCTSCPLRGECIRLPDNYRSYERYFSEKGFRRLGFGRNAGRSLWDYVKKK